jgi:hypothetical protein
VAQIELFGPDITGTFTATIVEVPSNAPTNVIPSDSSFRIDCDWFLEPPGKVVGGTWRIQAFLEALGNAPEIDSAPVAVAIDGRVTPPGPNYTQSLDFPAPQNLPAGQDSVLYKVGVALTYRTLAGTPGPFAAFVDLGVVEIFLNN